MSMITIKPEGIQVLQEWIPYEACIKVVSDREKTSHVLVFNLTGTERAFEVRLSAEEYDELRHCCKKVNPNCYFQTWQTGQIMAIAIVFLTGGSMLSMMGAIAAFFHQMKTVGWVLMALAIVGMLSNIFIKRSFSLMKEHDGSPARMKRARQANEAYRNALGCNEADQ